MKTKSVSMLFRRRDPRDKGPNPHIRAQPRANTIKPYRRPKPVFATPYMPSRSTAERDTALDPRRSFVEDHLTCVPRGVDLVQRRESRKPGFADVRITNVSNAGFAPIARAPFDLGALYQQQINAREEMIDELRPRFAPRAHNEGLLRPSACGHRESSHLLTVTGHGHRPDKLVDDSHILSPEERNENVGGMRGAEDRMARFGERHDYPSQNHVDPADRFAHASVHTMPTILVETDRPSFSAPMIAQQDFVSAASIPPPVSMAVTERPHLPSNVHFLSMPPTAACATSRSLHASEAERVVRTNGELLPMASMPSTSARAFVHEPSHRPDRPQLNPDHFRPASITPFISAQGPLNAPAKVARHHFDGSTAAHFTPVSAHADKWAPHEQARDDRVDVLDSQPRTSATASKNNARPDANARVDLNAATWAAQPLNVSVYAPVRPTTAPAQRDVPEAPERSSMPRASTRHGGNVARLADRPDLLTSLSHGNGCLRREEDLQSRSSRLTAFRQRA